MADISLDDLLKKKKEETVAPPSIETFSPEKQVVQVQRQVEQLTEKELQQVNAIKEAIDVTNSGLSLQYGAPAQKNIADFSESVLSRVKLKDSGEAGKLLGDLVIKIKGFTPDEDKSFLSKIPVIGTLVEKKDNFIMKYETLSQQIQKIQTDLDKSKIRLMEDVTMFDNLYEKNLEYFKALQLYIRAGEEKLDELITHTLPKLRDQAAQSTDPMAAQVVSDFEASVSRFEKKVHDLKLSNMIAMQTAPQIRLIQNSDKDLVERIQSAIYNAIPLWKNQMVIILGLSRQKEALQQQRAINNTTNELLKRNAEMLKQNSIEAAKENERSIVDVETLKKVNADLITTIEGIIKVQQDGRTKRQNAERELVAIEDKLKQALLKTNQTNVITPAMKKVYPDQ